MGNHSGLYRLRFRNVDKSRISGRASRNSPIPFPKKHSRDVRYVAGGTVGGRSQTVIPHGRPNCRCRCGSSTGRKVLLVLHRREYEDRRPRISLRASSTEAASPAPKTRRRVKSTGTIIAVFCWLRCKDSDNAGEGGRVRWFDSTPLPQDTNRDDVLRKYHSGDGGRADRR